MDNKLIDSYYSKMDHFSSDEKDILVQQEFLFLVKQLNKELDFLLDLDFVKFWFQITKIEQVLTFLDEFLGNCRKHSDIYQSLEIRSQDIIQIQRTRSGISNEQEQIHKKMNSILTKVLKVFFRLSQNMGQEDNEYFSPQFYNDMVYKNDIFDMAKLFDIAAIYGKSNPSSVN